MAASIKNQQIIMKNIIDQKFEVIARAVILHKNKILLCKQKEKDYYFLPGGHVEWGEGAQYALARELVEELNTPFKNFLFIGATENFFSGRQEINLLFAVSGGKPSEKSVEDHLEFCFVSKDEFSRMDVMPKSMKVAVTKWFKNKKSFLVSEGVK